MKKIICLLMIIGFSFFYVFVANAQFQVETNTKFKLADTSISIYIDNQGRYNQANGFEFDTTTGNSNGLTLEYGVTNSGGLFVNGNTMIIWNKGNNNRLLRIYDADGMSGSPERAYIDGEGYFYSNSDSNRKEQIKTLDSSLNQIIMLRAVKYHHKKTTIGNSMDSTSNQNSMSGQTNIQYYGFIAEEVKNVLPDVVGSDEYGNLFINYSGLIPLLLQAIKEQQNIITTQNNNINTLNQQIQDIQSQIQIINTKIK